MNPEARQVRDRFSRSSKYYHEHALVQRRVAHRLVERLELAVLKRADRSAVLELGCGSGFLTAEILRRYPTLRVTALDFSSEMLEEAQSYLQQSQLAQEVEVVWTRCDFLEYEARSPFDLVVSSSVLHWVSPLGQFLNKLRTCLVPGGVIAFALMLEGTLGELHRLRRECVPRKLPGRNLPTSAEVRELLANSGYLLLIAEEEEEREIYPNAESVLRAIHNQGFTSGLVSHGASLLTRGDLGELCRNYNDRYRIGAGVVATYRVGYFLARV